MKHDYKLSGVKYYNFEEDCKCKKGDKMKHEWEFVRVVTFGLVNQNPVASYACKWCGVKAEVYINHPETLANILGEGDCEGKKEDELTLRGLVAWLRTQGLAGHDPIDLITDALANISDRLDKLEDHWLSKPPVTRNG